MTKPCTHSGPRPQRIAKRKFVQGLAGAILLMNLLTETQAHTLANSGRFNPGPIGVESLIYSFKDVSDLRGNGLFINGEKYEVLKGEDSRIHPKITISAADLQGWSDDCSACSR